MLAYVSQEAHCSHTRVEVNVVNEFEGGWGCLAIVFLIRGSHRVSQMAELALKAFDVVLYRGLIKQVPL